MSFNRGTRFPAPEEISEPHISQAHLEHQQAIAQHRALTEDLIKHEGKRSTVLDADIRAAATARVAGSKDPVRKVLAHDARTEELRWGLKVAEETIQIAALKLDQAVREHSAEWIEQIQETVAELDREYFENVERLREIHAKRDTARGLLAKQTGTGALSPTVVFGGNQILDFQQGTPNARARIYVSDLLDALDTSVPVLDRERGYFEQHKAEIARGLRPGSFVVIKYDVPSGGIVVLDHEYRKNSGGKMVRQEIPNHAAAYHLALERFADGSFLIEQVGYKSALPLRRETPNGGAQREIEEREAFHARLEKTGPRSISELLTGQVA